MLSYSYDVAVRGFDCAVELSLLELVLIEKPEEIRRVLL